MAFFRTKWFDKDLEKSSGQERKRILKSNKKLRDEERGDVKQLEDDIWRLRAGDYRIFYCELAEKTYLLAAEYRRTSTPASR